MCLEKGISSHLCVRNMVLGKTTGQNLHSRVGLGPFTVVRFSTCWCCLGTTDRQARMKLTSVTLDSHADPGSGITTVWLFSAAS
jgi:hypothetical protein